MKSAEKLLGYMDQLQSIIEMLHSYVDRGIEFFNRIKEWITQAIHYIGKGVEYLVSYLGGRKSDHLQLADDYLFV